MALLVSGRIFGLLCLMAIMAAVAYYIRGAEKGKTPSIRRVAGIDAIDEAIGRAVEMGRPIVCSHGIANLRGATSGPQTLAGLSVLSYVTKKSIESNAKVIVPVRQPEVWPIAADIMETEYKLAGRSDEFDSDDVRFLSSNQFGYSSNYMGMMMRDQPGANIMIGAYWAESLQLAETGNRVGALQITGTANTHQIPFFLVVSDYCLIGEEIYSAGAYLTQDAPLIASLAGQDFGRIIAVILSVLGTLLNTAGITFLLDLFGM
jgi:hypothetical protein